MFKTQVTYPPSGTGPYAVPFPYIDSSHVKASVGSSSGLSVTIDDSGNAWLANTPSEDVKIYRETPTSPLVDFSDTSILREADLDLAVRQALYLVEEAQDKLLLAGQGGVVNYITSNTYFGPTQPTGNIETGAIWFDAADNNRIYRWDGSSWVDVQKVLQEEDFGLGIKPVKIVQSLPPSANEGDVVSYEGTIYTYIGGQWEVKVPSSAVVGEIVGSQIAQGAISPEKLMPGSSLVRTVGTLPPDNSEGDVVLLTGEWALYRWDASIPGWTKATKTADLEGTIGADKIAANSILASHIVAGAINVSHLAAEAVTADKIAANAVTADKIAADSVDANKLTAGAVTADKLAANSVTAGKIQSGAIVAAHIGANQIITQAANIGEAVITDAHIANLNAGKVVSGDMQAMSLAVATTFYNPNAPARKFRSVSYATSYDDGHNFGDGTGFAFNHPIPVRFYTPGHSGGGTPIFNVGDDGAALISLQARLVGYTGICTAYYKLASSSFFVPLLSAAVDNSPLTGFRYVHGVNFDDVLEVYIAPCDANGNIVSPNYVGRYEIDVMVHNWR